MSTSSAITELFEHLQSDRDAALERLIAFVSIPTISTDPAYRSHVQRGAEWVAATLEQIGLEVTMLPTDGHPAVLGLSRQEGDDPETPRVLYYGHYDVQPPDPLEDWISPPFEPSIRDGAIHGRGASDDKGQVCCFLEALRAWQRIYGRFPCPVAVLIEGEEEVGSAHLPALIQQHCRQLAAKVVVISDTTMWDSQTVAITYGLRGMLYFDIQLHGPNRDLHSGVYGGAVPNPAIVLATILADLFDDQHRLRIDGFYDDVLSLDEKERADWAALQFDERAFLGGVGVKAGYGESGFDLLERRWARPAVEVCGLYGGYTGPGAKTIIPSFAGAKIGFRLAPNQVPEKIAGSFSRWLDAQPVHGLRWKIEEFGRADPVVVQRRSPLVGAAARAIEFSSGRPPVLVREGATIPVVSDFKRLIGADSLLIGFGLHDDRIHAPNEKFNLDCFEMGCRTHAALLAELAGA